MSEPTITGEWSGLYVYAPQFRGMALVRFEAEFGAPTLEGAFRGHITDGGGVGEAAVTGIFAGRIVQFVKVYDRTVYRKARPIHYEGTLSGDGLHLNGTWRINSRWLGLIPLRAEGVWRAQRPGLPEPPIAWPPPPQT